MVNRSRHWKQKSSNSAASYVSCARRKRWTGPTRPPVGASFGRTRPPSTTTARTTSTGRWPCGTLGTPTRPAPSDNEQSCTGEHWHVHCPQGTVNRKVGRLVIRGFPGQRGHIESDGDSQITGPGGSSARVRVQLNSVTPRAARTGCGAEPVP